MPPLSTYLIRLTPPGTLNFVAWNFSSGSASTARVLMAGPFGCTNAAVASPFGSLAPSTSDPAISTTSITTRETHDE